jgi:hypothetical protein
MNTDLKTTQHKREVEMAVQAIIEGHTVVIKDVIRNDVRSKLREIKENCTIVLSQMREL